MKLTLKTVRDLPTTGERYWVDDEALRGFRLQVSASGSKTYYVRLRSGGRVNRSDNMFKIGAAAVVTPEQARDQARTLLARHLVGDDPIADRRQRQEIPTVSALCALFLDSIWGKRKSSTVYGYSKLIECHIEPGLGQRKVDALDPALVSRWHSNIGQSKPAAANRALRLLSTIYRWAHHSGILAQEVRLARATTKYREVAKERYLSGEEVQRLWAALDQAEREGIAADPSRSVLAAKRNRGIKRPRRLTASSSVMRWTWHGVKVPVMVSRPSSHCVGHPLSRWSTYSPTDAATPPSTILRTRSPHVSGRSTVSGSILFGYSSCGDTLDAFLSDFPSVTREQAIATLDAGTALLVAQVARR